MQKSLPIFNRIFEKRLYNHLKSFVEKNDLLYEAQYGFWAILCAKTYNIAFELYCARKIVCERCDFFTPRGDNEDIYLNSFLHREKSDKFDCIKCLIFFSAGIYSNMDYYISFESV